MNEFLQRLKERKLVQWTVAYVAARSRSFKGLISWRSDLAGRANDALSSLSR